MTVSTAGTTGSNSGSIQLNLTVKSPIADVAGNALAGTAPIAGQAYTYDTTPPADADDHVRPAAAPELDDDHECGVRVHG